MGMQRGGYDRSIYDLFAHQKGADPASPDTLVRRTMLRTDIASSAGAAAPATGVLLVQPVVLQSGDTITNISFVTGGTAATSPTAGFVALFNSAGALVANSADFGAAAMGASTVFTKALATPYKVPASGVYYVGFCLSHGGAPTLLGTPVAPAVVTGEASVARISSTTYTTAPPNALPTLNARVDAVYFVLT